MGQGRARKSQCPPDALIGAAYAVEAAAVVRAMAGIGNDKAESVDHS